MDDAVKLVLVKKIADESFVNNIPFYKSVIGLVFDVGNIFEISGIREQIKIKNLIIRVVQHKTPHDVRSDEACAARN